MISLQKKFAAYAFSNLFLAFEKFLSLTKKSLKNAYILHSKFIDWIINSLNLIKHPSMLLLIHSLSEAQIMTHGV